jgi:hypothetical protein
MPSPIKKADSLKGTVPLILFIGGIVLNEKIDLSDNSI